MEQAQAVARYLWFPFESYSLERAHGKGGRRIHTTATDEHATAGVHYRCP